MASGEIRTISIVLGFFLSYLALGGASNYADLEKASESVVIVAKVFCDTCLEDRFSENGYAISGASIAVECFLNRKTMTVPIIGETDDDGVFMVELPSSIFLSADQLNQCLVRPRNSPEESCRIPSKSAPSKLTLQSDSNGVLTYSAGSFSYRPETVPSSCYREDSFPTVKGQATAKNVDQSLKAGQETLTNPRLPKFEPATFPNFGIPPLPQIPSRPTIPRLPKLPRLPSFGYAPLPTTPPLPSIAPPPSSGSAPQPSIPPLPSFPPLNSIPHLPKIHLLPRNRSLPYFGLPPLPTIPPLPKTAPLPNFGHPPFLPELPPLRSLNLPPFPEPTIPGPPSLP